MTALAASSAFRLPDATRRRRVGWPVALSILLHLALLALAIVAAQHKHPLPQSVPPASLAMVFEGGGNTPPSIANPAPVSPNQQASPEPQPATPLPPLPAPPVAPTPLPVAPTPTAPPAETPPTQEVTPPPQEVIPPAQEVIPLPQEVVPPAQEPAPPPPPLPALEAVPRPLPEISAPPSTTAPAEQVPGPKALPLPPPVPVPAPEVAPQPAPPRPQQAIRPVSPPHTAPDFPAPMDFSLGPSVAAPQATQPRSRASPGTMDLSFAPMMGGGDITQLHPQGKGDDVGEDWFNEVAAWWLRHRFYPNEAARLAQEGDVTLHLVVGRDGRVEAVDVERKSGSPWLDMGALAVFRDAKLPPLPPDVRDPNITVEFVIHYVILR